MPQLFSKVEKKLLIALVNKFNYMVDTKCEDAHLKKSRVKEAWRHIQNEFNLVSSQKRTLTQLQRFWSKVKKDKKNPKHGLVSLEETTLLSQSKSNDSPTHLLVSPRAINAQSTQQVNDIKDRGDIFEEHRISHIQLQNLVNRGTIKRTNDVAITPLISTPSSTQFDNVVNELHVLQRKELNLNIKAAERRNRILEIDLKRAQIELNNAIEIGKRMIDISDIKMQKATRTSRS